MDCDAVYKEYGGKSVSSATAEGVFAGLSGLVGAGGFWNPVNEDALNNIVNDFNNVKDKWNNILAQYEGKLSQAQADFHARQLELLEEIDTFNDQILKDDITKNSLYITILFVALIIVIVYLIVL